MLSEKELWKLRKQVCIGSLYLHDYENTFGIDTNECCSFFDGYLSYISELMEEDGIPDDKFWECIDAYDNEDNLYYWYECFESDPLEALNGYDDEEGYND